MNCTIYQEDLISPYGLLFKSLSLIPISHYFLWIFSAILVFFYCFLEIRLLHDLLITGFRGDPVSLTYNAGSELYQSVAAKCQLLHGRYLPTPWLSSPHLQTAFLSLFGTSPQFRYRRHLFQAKDGGTIALDWLMHSDGVTQGNSHVNASSQGNDRTPIVIVIPGLTSDSSAAAGKAGLECCCQQSSWPRRHIINQDIRKVVDHIHCQYPEAPLFAVGTSIGANILVKYLGEDGPDTLIVGAAAVCSPWDLLICDRYINRRLVQKFYDRVLTVGLQGYARLHQSILSRLADWEGIEKSRSVREFDNYATRLVGKFETVDTFYRRSSSAPFVGNVSVPLLCISALDDPVCTREAIPWDECRANENIILATTRRGGHLAYYEGMTANSMWWVRAVGEYLGVLLSNPFADKRKKIPAPTTFNPLESSIDQGPYVNVVEDGMLAAVSEVQTGDTEDVPSQQNVHTSNKEVANLDGQKRDVMRQKAGPQNDAVQPSDQSLGDLVIPLRKRVDQLSRHSRKSIWLLAYVAIVTTWPLLGPALLLSLKKRLKNFVPAGLLRR